MFWGFCVSFSIFIEEEGLFGDVGREVVKKEFLIREEGLGGGREIFWCFLEE